MTAQSTARPWGQDLPPLRLTFAHWVNRKQAPREIDGQRVVRWSKVLAHKGSYEQFAYGTDTPSDWRPPLQRCVICSRESGVIAVDVDDEDLFRRSRTGQLIGRANAVSAHGRGYHVLIDARAVPEADWPTQGPIPGGDIKSRGFVPVPGSQHWDGRRYEPLYRPALAATQELIAAINADREHAASAQAAGNGHGSGGGHDGELAAAVLSMVLHGLPREQCYAEWSRIAVPRDPSWPFTRADFERHHRTAVAKAGKIQAENESAAASWAQAEAAQGRAVAVPAPVQGVVAGEPPGCAEAEAVYSRWLHDTDPVPTRIVLATYAANMALEGDPVWLMLVGGSGIGKTERISPVASMPGVVMVSTLTGEAALLSASPKRERAKNATGGVLRQVGTKGVLVVKDFTSVLSMSRDRRAEVVAALREIYDGRWDRHYGTDGGQVLTWEGHCGFIAGCTTAIDGAHSVLDAMGTRFLFVRMPDADLDMIGTAALASAGREREMRAELAEVTAGLLRNLGKPHELHEGVRRWLLPLAEMASQARSPVERDYQGEISLVLDAEAPTRLIKQLGQLWRACGMLGLDESHSWAAVRRAGLDSIPKLRRAVIECLGQHVGYQLQYGRRWQPTTDIAKAVGHPSRTTRRALEDLAAHDLVDRQDTELGELRKTYSWALSARALTWWNALSP